MILKTQTLQYVPKNNLWINDKPLTSNYLVEFKDTLIGKQPFITTRLNRLIGPSTLTLEIHSKIANLTQNDVITLSDTTAANIEKCLDLEE